MVLALAVAAVTAVSCSSPLLPDENGESPTDSSSPTDSIVIIPHDSVTVVHTGGDGDPYTVAEAQWVASASAVWVEGYVVGTVKGSMANGCTLVPPFTTDTNILLADTFPCSPGSCLPVELPQGSLYHYALNLVDNPTVYLEKRRIQGDLTTYFRTVGLRNVRIVAHPHDPDTPADSTSTTPTNTIDTPLSILQAIALQSSSGSSSGTSTEMQWVRGIIVGWSPARNRVTVADSTGACTSALRTNVLLANSIGETSPTRLLVVKLPSGCVRDDVNLLDNPTNLHHALTVKGCLRSYNGLPGCVDILGASRREDGAGHPLYRLE